MSHKKTIALILASGEGARLGSDIPKQYLPLGDKMMLEWSLYQFQNHAKIDDVYLVVNPAHKHLYGILPNTVKIIEAAGASRQETVAQALKKLELLEAGIKNVLIHDSARPFVDAKIIDNVLDELGWGTKACYPAIDCVDTVRDKNSGNVIDRENLLLVQTPQGFDFNTLIKSYNSITDYEGFTDDVSIIQKIGIKALAVEGSRENFKITTKFDYRLAKKLI